MCPDCRGVVRVFPVGALHTPALVVLLGHPPSDELAAPHNDVWGRVTYEQVNVIARDHDIENAHAEALPAWNNP